MKTIKHLGINWTKMVKDLSKEIEEDTNQWLIFHVLGLEELKLWKCPYHQKWSTDQYNLYQNSNSIFHRNRNKTILKFVWNSKDSE